MKRLLLLLALAAAAVGAACTPITASIAGAGGSMPVFRDAL